jgi:hypothetical protein
MNTLFCFCIPPTVPALSGGFPFDSAPCPPHLDLLYHCLWLFIEPPMYHARPCACPSSHAMLSRQDGRQERERRRDGRSSRILDASEAHLARGAGGRGTKIASTFSRLRMEELLSTRRNRAAANLTRTRRHRQANNACSSRDARMRGPGWGTEQQEWKERQTGKRRCRCDGTGKIRQNRERGGGGCSTYVESTGPPSSCETKAGRLCDAVDDSQGKLSRSAV